MTATAPERNLIIAEILRQFGVPKRWLRRLLGLTKRQVHILTERERMTRALWLDTMFKDNWTCYLCGIRNLRNQEWGKPKMEAEHVLALANGGYTVPSNLRCACKPCNLRKGVKLI